MEIRPGLKLASTVSAAQFVVIRGLGDVDLRHAGTSLSTDMTVAPSGAEATGEVLVGKRYSNATADIEFLCVKAGAGDLTVGGEILAVGAAKALPASD